MGYLMMCLAGAAVWCLITYALAVVWWPIAAIWVLLTLIVPCCTTE